MRRCNEFSFVAPELYYPAVELLQKLSIFAIDKHEKLLTSQGNQITNKDLHMTPATRLNVLGIQTNGLTSIRSPFSVLMYTDRNLLALFSGLWGLQRGVW